MMEKSHSLFFRNLNQELLEKILGRMKYRNFEPQQFICRQGDPGNSLFLIQNGLVNVLIDGTEGPFLVNRLRRGEVAGEMSLITGEPRSASLLAVMPTDVLELEREEFARIVSEHPEVLFNINLILIERQRLSDARRLASRSRGEALALILGSNQNLLVQEAIAAARRSRPRPISVIDLTRSLAIETEPLEESQVAQVLTALDLLLTERRIAMIVADPQQKDLDLLLKNMDRVIVVMEPGEAECWAAISQATRLPWELFLIDGEGKGRDDPRLQPHVIRTCRSGDYGTDIAWLGRHLARTKIGIAFGAGGAKGFAHIGVLRVLERAGYIIDYVTGSSAGAVVGAQVAMGKRTDEVAQATRHLFSVESIGPLFKIIPEGEMDAISTFRAAIARVTEVERFEDLSKPLAVMTADLNTHQAHLITEGSLAEALYAATALPGLCPPFEVGPHRLVDGVTISPVPTRAARNAGADVTLSVNLMSRETLEAWPEEIAHQPPRRARPSKSLDPLLETLVMLQLQTSIDHAAEADVVITPRFAHSSWRDIDLAPQFEDAGRLAAESCLDQLGTLARPSAGR